MESGKSFEPRDPSSLAHGELIELVVGLQAMVTHLLEQNAQLLAENAAQARRIAELERELGRNSENSGLPPSSDSHTDRSSRAARKRVKNDGRKRRQGGQPGHQGKTLARVDDPDVIVEHVPSTCDGCNRPLDGATPLGWVSRQVFDTPEPVVRVTDHRVHTLRCDCGCQTTAAWPAEATGPACWGPNVKAIALYLLCVQQVPYDRCAQTLADVLRAAVSTGTLAAWVLEASGCLDAFDQVIRALLALAPVVYADETTCRVAETDAVPTEDVGDATITRTQRRRQRRQQRQSAQHRGARRTRIRHKRYVHVAATPLLTHFGLHIGRGAKAMTEIGVLPTLSGYLVHDGYLEYLTFDNVTHAACAGHVLRNLASVAEIGTQADWADAMIDLLCDLIDTADTAWDSHRGDAKDPPRIAANVLAKFKKRYQAIIDAGYTANPEPDRKRDDLERESFNLVVRLDTRRDEVLRFAHDLQIEPTSNNAERPLRPLKLHDKISGTFRSATHAKAWLRIRSYIATADKNGINILTALSDAITGTPWLPTAPQ